MNGIKRWYAENSNPDQLSGQPDDVIEGMDLFVGLSGPGIIQAESLAKMNDDAIVFAMANPNPEVMPEDAAPYVRIMATGRSDYPNQINNVLAFPGIFRGALDAGAPRITEEMKLAAAKGIAMAVTEEDLSEDYIIPSVFNREVAPKVAEAVVEEAKREGIARFNEETGHLLDRGVGRPVRGGRRRREGPRHRSQRLHRLGAVRRAAGPGRHGRRPDPRPASARAAPTRAIAWHAWEPTLERPPAAAFEGVDGVVNLRRREDQPALDRRGEASGSWRAAAPATHNLVGAIAGLERRPRVLVNQSAIGFYGDRGDAVVDESARPGGEGFDAEVVQEWEKAAREVEGAGVRLVIVRTGHVLDPSGGLLGRAAAAVQARGRRAARRRRAVRLLDPHRGRGRDPALGARQRAR